MKKVDEHLLEADYLETPRNEEIVDIIEAQAS